VSSSRTGSSGALCRSLAALLPRHDGTFIGLTRRQPCRFRRRALEFGSGLPTSVICSSLIARAFQNVGFPILPTRIPDGTPTPVPRLRDRLRGVRAPYPGLFHQVPALITPRDFDLSPYFTIVKFNAVEASFDYRRIRWTSDTPQLAQRGSRS